MKITTFSALILSGVLLLSSCEDRDPVVSDISTQPSAAQLDDFVQNKIEEAVQDFIVDATSPVKITGIQGTEVQFVANGFVDAVGNPITGNVDIELIEVYDKADMFFLNKQTLGDDNGSFSPLISGGEFKVSASQNGNEVFLKPGFGYSTVVQAPSGIDPSMDIFYQSSVSSDTMVWTQADSSAIFGSGGVYNAVFDSLGWVNCDYFMNLPGPQTPVTAQAPTGFDNTNMLLFISFDGYNSLTSIYNYSNGLFNTGPYYTIPVGLDVHFIALAFINNEPYSAIIPSTIVNNHLEVIGALNQTTITQLTLDIQNLP